MPLLLGSAGIAACALHIAVLRDILCEVAAEEGLRFSLAVIHAEQDKAYLKKFKDMATLKWVALLCAASAPHPIGRIGVLPGAIQR
jgi:hypothetical protein